jgi:hypothetical protein
VVEGQHIRAPWKLNDDGILGTVRSIVFAELNAQATCLNAHHRIQLGIKVRGSAKDLGRYLVFLNWSSGMIEDVLCKVTEELAQGFGAMQDVAIDQLVDLPEILLAFGQETLVTTG